MAQFKSLVSGVEVNGQTVLSIANGLGSMKSMGLRILEEHDLKDIKPDGWYPQQNWLDAFRQIAEKVGINTLYKIGMSIPENAKFPPDIDDIHKGLAAIDIAFHMNHRLNGKILVNPANGQILEGIGHYSYKKIGETAVDIICDNSYPCDFDRGIIEAMANKFKPANAIIRLEHDEAKGCRKKNGNACVYRVSW